MLAQAEIVNNRFCSACALGVLCLADGPIPDFEVAGIAALYGIWS